MLSHSTKEDMEAQDRSTCSRPKQKVEELVNEHTKTQSKTHRRTWAKSLISWTRGWGMLKFEISGQSPLKKSYTQQAG